MLLSLAFWVMLAVAGACFAATLLAPKLASLLELEHEFQAGQLRLNRLEQQTLQLEQLVKALKDDPQFAAELARLEFDAIRPGEEILAVSGPLVMNPRLVAEHALNGPATDASGYDPWFAPTVRQLAGSPSWRNALLATAATLTLLAFTFLQECSSTPTKNS